MNLRAWRRQKGLSLRELAARTHLTRGYLSKIERARTPPPVSTLQTIAYALDLDVADLLDGRGAEPSPRRPQDGLDIVPAAEAARGQSTHTEGGYDFRPLLRRYRHRQMSPFLMIVRPGRTRRFAHDSEEFGYLAQGRVTLEYAGRKHPLETGDSFYLDSRIRHAFRNPGPETAVIVSVNYNYRRF